MRNRNFSIVRLAGNVLLGFAVIWLAIAPALAAPTSFDYAWNFDASDVTPVNGFFTFSGTNSTPNTFQFEGGPNLHITSGTDGILGPFGYGASGPVQNGSSITMRIAAPEGGTIDSFNLSFQLWTINTWDGNGTFFNGVYYPNDYFQVALGSVNGRGCSAADDLFCESFSVRPDVFMSYGGPSTLGGVGATFARWTGNANDLQAQGNFPYAMSSDGYGVWDISLGQVNLGVPVSELVIIFRGLQMQDGADESWALGRVNISGVGESAIIINADVGDVPEPSSVILSGFGLALLAILRYRRSARA